MSDDGASPETSSGQSIPEGAISRELPITNKRGLHARASAKFVQMVERFEADVWVTKGGETVGGTSIMGLMMLGAGFGSQIELAGEGWDAREAIEALAGLVESGFDERD
jgi:phosphocarrier protein